MSDESENIVQNIYPQDFEQPADQDKTIKKKKSKKLKPKLLARGKKVFI